MLKCNFKCQECGCVFGVMATIEEKEKTIFDCPKCGSSDTEEKFSLRNLFGKSNDCDCNCKK